MLYFAVLSLLCNRVTSQLQGDLHAEAALSSLRGLDAELATFRNQLLEIHRQEGRINELRQQLGEDTRSGSLPLLRLPPTGTQFSVRRPASDVSGFAAPSEAQREAAQREAAQREVALARWREAAPPSAVARQFSGAFTQSGLPIRFASGSAASSPTSFAGSDFYQDASDDASPLDRLQAMPLWYLAVALEAILFVVPLLAAMCLDLNPGIRFWLLLLSLTSFTFLGFWIFWSKGMIQPILANWAIYAYTFTVLMALMMLLVHASLRDSREYMREMITEIHTMSAEARVILRRAYEDSDHDITHDARDVEHGVHSAERQLQGQPTFLSTLCISGSSAPRKKKRGGCC